MPKNKTLRGLSDLLKSIDLQGESVNFQIRNQSSYRTRCGGFVTLFVSFFLIIYSSQKFMTMVHRGETKYQRVEHQFAIPNRQKFEQAEMDIDIAFTIIDRNTVGKDLELVDD